MVSFQANSIRNILTLRYDPTKRSSEKKLRPQDFKQTHNEDNLSEIIESMVKNEIRLRIGKADNIAIPIGSGIDSAVILALAKEIFPNKNIFGISLGFCDPQDETEGARRICHALNAECFALNVENVLEDLPFQISIVGEPRWNLWYYYVSEYAKKLGADIMLTGDGGDELFAGYVFRYAKYQSLMKDKHEPPISFPPCDVKWVRKAWSYLQCHDRDWVPDQEEIFGQEMSQVFDWYTILCYFRPYFDNNLDQELNQVLLADYNGKLLYDWIPTNTKLSKYFKIKTLTPLLGCSITKFAPHIPIEKKYNPKNQEGKLILREILEKHGILHLIAKKKQGFGMDLVNLWRTYGEDMAQRYLANAQICQREIVDKVWIKKTMDNPKISKDPRNINKILQLVALEIWYRTFVRKETVKK